MFKPGDSVAVLHDTIKGVVVDVDGDQVKMEDEHGFVRMFKNSELVLQNTSENYRIGSDILPKDKPAVTTTKLGKNAANNIKVQDRFEIDLHIEELLDYHTHLANYEIVRTQMTACRSFVYESMELKRKRIVIIHGKGEGVLKSEIHTYLNRLANEKGVRIEYHDAPFQTYGMGGATEVLFG